MSINDMSSRLRELLDKVNMELNKEETQEITTQSKANTKQQRKE